MHRAIAAWLTERPWRAAVASAFCGALSPQMLLPFAVLAGAIPALIALRFDPKTGLGVAAAGAVAAASVVLSVTAPTVWVFVAIGLLFVGPLALALLLRNTGSIVLCFQVAVLGAAAVLIGVHLALPDPIAVWADLLHKVMDSMAEAGIRLEGDQDEIVAVWARTMWGALAALALAIVFGGLLLGRWWLSLLHSPGQFGAEYRKLRLGTALGVTITLLFVAGSVNRIFADRIAGVGRLRGARVSGSGRRAPFQGGRTPEPRLAGGDLCAAGCAFVDFDYRVYPCGLGIR